MMHSCFGQENEGKRSGNQDRDYNGWPKFSVYHSFLPVTDTELTTPPGAKIFIAIAHPDKVGVPWERRMRLNLFSTYFL
jgi:hypothetical protein